jgi:hypothetical protein
MVYVLRRNFRFAQELKSDQFAVSDRKDFHHLLDGLLALDRAKKEKSDSRVKCNAVNTFISGDDGLVDRLKVLALREESRNKRIVANVCYSIVIVALFIASYMFTILPIFWESPDIQVSTRDFVWEDSEYGDVFRVGENFLVDKRDGTFALYIDGQFVRYIDESNEIINLLPIRAREAD